MANEMRGGEGGSTGHYSITRYIFLGHTYKKMQQMIQSPFSEPSEGGQKPANILI